MSLPLTEAQAAVLAFIREHLKAEQRPPTLHEISKRFGWSSPNAGLAHLKPLVKKGFIQREGGRIKLLGVNVTLTDAA